MSRLAFMPIMVDRPGAMRLHPSAPAPEPFPMELLEAHERQAFINHDQSLQMLASRGGLSPGELVALLESRRWRPMDTDQALELVERYRRDGALTGPDRDDRE
jgi:hypothetical protein